MDDLSLWVRILLIYLTVNALVGVLLLRRGILREDAKRKYEAEKAKLEIRKAQHESFRLSESRQDCAHHHRDP